MPKINIEQFYNENKEEHQEIKKGLGELNKAVNNHVGTIAADIGTMKLSIVGIDGKYTNIKWLIGLLTATIAIGILAKFLI